MNDSIADAKSWRLRETIASSGQRIIPTMDTRPSPIKFINGSGIKPTSVGTSAWSCLMRMRPPDRAMSSEAEIRLPATGMDST